MPKQSLDFSGNLETARVATYLEDLARCLRAGSVSMKSADQAFDLLIGENVGLDLEARSTGKGRSSIELKLDWRRRKRRLDDAPALIIFSPADSEAPGRDDSAV